MLHLKQSHSLLVAAAVVLLFCFGVSASVSVTENTSKPLLEDLRCSHITEDVELESTAGSPVVNLFPISLHNDVNASSNVSDLFMPIRIALSTADLENTRKFCSKEGQVRPNFFGGLYTCKLEDIFDDSKMVILLANVNAAVTMHYERLSVMRARGNIVVSLVGTQSYCKEFTVPPLHRRAGVADADFVAYIAVGATLEGSAGWSYTCTYFPDGRPAVGVALFSPQFISASSQHVRFATHLFLHALGFNPTAFWSAKMMKKETVPGRLEKTLVLYSPKVLAVAQAHYGCPSMEYVELESEGSNEIVGSHWDRRTAKEDLMCGIVGMAYYTAMTLAAMEDLGYYKANYYLSEVMPWGRNASCSLFKEKCVNSDVSQFPSMFCTSVEERDVCTSDRRGIGYCGLQMYKTDLPVPFQHFSNPKLGSLDWSLMKHCPTIELSPKTRCSDGDADSMPGSILGKSSRCFDLSNGNVFMADNSAKSVKAICIAVLCARRQYSVRVLNSTIDVLCKPGTELSLPSLSPAFKSGKLTCPPYNQVCYDFNRKKTFTQVPAKVVVPVAVDVTGTRSSLAAMWIVALMLVLYASGTAS